MLAGRVILLAVILTYISETLQRIKKTHCHCNIGIFSHPHFKVNEENKVGGMTM